MGTLGKESIPSHLPHRLAISLWVWCWFTDTQPGEAFHDLEKCFQELVARGYNTVRIDAMLGWIYDQQGRRRGPVTVGQIAQPGYAHYEPGLTARGGGTADAYEQLVRLLRLAQKYDVYVALTTWQYQEGHSTTLMADPTLQDEIHAVPLNERLPFIARQYETLLQALQAEGLIDRIAYVELHNEIDYAKVYAQRDQLQALMESALGYLQARFPTLLICSDRNAGSMDAHYGYDYQATARFTEGFACNDQLIDHHLYVGGVQSALLAQAGLSFPVGDQDDIDDQMNAIEQHNQFLRWLLKPDYEPWESFKQHFSNPSLWRRLFYFFENVDIDKYDYWMFTHYPRYEQAMKNFWKNSIQHLHAYARQRGLPLVCDEGYVFWPPMHSQFEVSTCGKEFHEYIVELMIQHEYWGIMITTYAFPSQPLWEKESAFLLKLNRRILEP
ncbi:MAG: cellulase-like family protein [Anaerolineae bacterium]